MKGLKIIGIGLVIVVLAFMVIMTNKLSKRSDAVIAQADAYIKKYEEVLKVVEIETIRVEITQEEEVLINAHRDMDIDNSDDRNDYSKPEASNEDAEKETEVYTFTENEIWEMTRIVYLENGIVEESTDETLYLTACVILNRLYDWNECNSIYDVIWENGQYSTADRYADYDESELGTSNPNGWDRSYSAVCKAIENTDRNPHFQSTFAQGEIYYTDPNTGEVFCY